MQTNLVMYLKQDRDSKSSPVHFEGVLDYRTGKILVRDKNYIVPDGLENSGMDKSLIECNVKDVSLVEEI